MRTPQFSERTNRFKTTKNKEYYDYHAGKRGRKHRARLKKFKRKYERTGVLKELRRRQYFTKPSIAKREAMQHAIYVEHMYRNDE